MLLRSSLKLRLGRGGTKGVPGEEGMHFNQPTDIAFGSKGRFCISDG
jgi:hypothetical protein